MFSDKESPASTGMIVAALKADNQDFEWYPTTDEIIDAVAHAIKGEYDTSYRGRIMDVGCGDGRVLLKLREKVTKDPDDVQLFGLEKADLHRTRMRDDILMVGKDFHMTNLTATATDILFCNPPYSEYETWMSRLIKDAYAESLYFVVPKRWTESEDIKQALRVRGCKAPKVLGSFSFENGERRARVEVDLVYIWTLSGSRHSNKDPFDSFFDEMFGPVIAAAQARKEDSDKCSANEAARENGEIVTGVNFAQRLVFFYQQDVEQTQTMFAQVAKLDSSILAELEIDLSPLRKKLRHRLESLRTKYWHALFKGMDSLTKLFTSYTHKLVTGRINGQATCLDFNLDNITTIVQWLMRNADKYYDKQFLHVYDQLIEQANVRNYKSNQRVFQSNTWRYSRDTPPGEGGGDNSHYGLDYRLVITKTGGLRKQPSYSRNPYKLSESAAALIQDILTVAMCLGFDVVRYRAAEWLSDTFDAGLERWEPGSSVEFPGFIAGKPVTLLKAKAFLNGNMHIHMNQKLMMTFNVEYGRLKGWIASGPEAAEELSPIDEKTAKSAASAFGLLRPFSDQPLLLNE